MMHLVVVQVLLHLNSVVIMIKPDGVRETPDQIDMGRSGDKALIAAVT
jgi:hypothetical protein